VFPAGQPLTLGAGNSSSPVWRSTNAEGRRGFADGPALQAAEAVIASSSTGLFDGGQISRRRCRRRDW